MKTIWQIASGDTNRDFADISIKYGVILNGPGYVGRLPENKDRLKKDNWTSKKQSDLMRFATEIKDGDLIVMRLGTSIVRAVGLVVGDYDWSEAFGDVDGWDLQHYRRVHWFLDLTHEPHGGKVFEKYAMKFGDTTQHLNPGAVYDWVKSLEIPAATKTLPALPAVNKKVPTHEIKELLKTELKKHKGIELDDDRFDKLLATAKTYIRKNDTSEAETLAFLAVPFFELLGWPQSMMSIEWQRIDLALFDGQKDDANSLKVVVEAKRRSNSCMQAIQQATTYAARYKNCKQLILTDGIRYAIYHKQNDQFVLTSYLNLLNPVEEYEIYNCAGARQAITALVNH